MKIIINEITSMDIKLDDEMNLMELSSLVDNLSKIVKIYSKDLVVDIPQKEAEIPTTQSKNKRTIEVIEYTKSIKKPRSTWSEEEVKKVIDLFSKGTEDGDNEIYKISGWNRKYNINPYVHSMLKHWAGHLGIDVKELKRIRSKNKKK